jgi:pyridoxal phosphate enzyme (YggS family)
VADSVTVGALDPGRVRANLAAVRERIGAACGRAGRDPGEIELLAATKYVAAEQMGVLAEAGIELVGENTAQALTVKRTRWGDRFTFDFIGHLQSRKTRDVLSQVRLIHSVETESVLKQLERHAPGRLRVLLEVNLAEEASKHGLRPDRVESFLEIASGCENVSFAGLMTMPPLATDPELVRPHFVALRELADRLGQAWAPRHDFRILSMGTSQDFEVAVEEGATILRLGSVLYA